MPIRNVRNFWIELEVDGRKSVVATGPVRADGGFKLRIRQREQGGIAEQDTYIVGRVSPQDGIKEACILDLSVPMNANTMIRRLTRITPR